MPGYVPAAGEDMELHINTVERDYFATMGIVADAGTASSTPSDSPHRAGRRRERGLRRPLLRRQGGRPAASDRRERPSSRSSAWYRCIDEAACQDAPAPVVFHRLGRDFMSRAPFWWRRPPRARCGSLRTDPAAGQRRSTECVAIFRIDHARGSPRRGDGRRIGSSVDAGRGRAARWPSCWRWSASTASWRTRWCGGRARSACGVALGAQPGQVLGLLAARRRPGHRRRPGVRPGRGCGLDAAARVDALRHQRDRRVRILLVVVSVALRRRGACWPAACPRRGRSGSARSRRSDTTSRRPTRRTYRRAFRRMKHFR